MSLSHLIGPELKTLLDENPEEVQEVLDDIHPEDMADIIGQLDANGAGRVLLQLPTEYAAQVFERLDEEQQTQVSNQLGPESTARIALEMDPDDRVDFFSNLEPDHHRELMRELKLADPDAAEEVRELQRWEETSAGGLMTTQFLSVSPDRSISQATEIVRRFAEDAETVGCVYVTDANKRLLGLLTMRQILLAQENEIVSDVMHRNVKDVRPELHQEEVARTLAKYDLSALPVVGDAGELLGVITADDVMDVIREEQSEDVHKMGAIDPIRDGYFETEFSVFLKKRAPWLVVLFLGGFLSTQTMQGFEAELNSVTALAFYLPLLISAGGNSGSQSSTLVIRGLAVGDITGTDWGRVLTRELLQGITLGLLLAVLGVARSMLAGDGVEFALLIGATIVSIVVMGCVTGAMAPIVLSRLGVDPATSSTPFIATLVDVLGIALYLSLARVLLSAVIVPGV